MFQRLIRQVLLLLGALALLPAAASAERVVVVGDLHGDFEAWQAIARAARIMNPQGGWAGGNATLVQLGDVTDRGSDSLRIIRSLQQLQREAPKARGRVVVLLGNHEAMNLLGDLRYTTPAEFAAFADNRSVARRERLYGSIRQQLEATARATNPEIRPSEVREQWLARTPLGWVEHRRAWSPQGELGRWAAANPAVAKIGDTVFAHGGLSAEYAAVGIDEINRRAAAAMAAADDRPTSILNDLFGPLWYRGLVTRDPRLDPDGAQASVGKVRPTIDDELTAVLAASGAKRIVVGHTPSLRGVIVSNGGRLVRVDTGNARHYGGQLGYLEIAGSRVTPHTVPRTAPAAGGTQ